MKLRTIYFAGSITGGRQDVAVYRTIVGALRVAGHRVLAEAVPSDEITSEGESLDRYAVFSRDLEWIDRSDVLVAEISMPSVGVGYEIAYARHVRKMPVIGLYRPAYTKRCSSMISGDRGIRLIEYAEDGLGMAIGELIRALGE
jgi:hypothetical protein